MAWSLGLLYSPENLILVGNLAGSSGAAIVMLFIAGAFLYWQLATTYGNMLARRPKPTTELDNLSLLISKLPAAVLALSGRLALALCMATAALVASGFIFNEVFFNRFPNFAFAFLLLGLILGIQLLGGKPKQVFQVTMVSVAIGGLVVLSAAGFKIWIENIPIIFTPTVIPPLKSITGVLMVFVGFELLLYARKDAARYPSQTLGQFVAAILLTAVVFTVWAFGSLASVDAGRLSDTTIPHILAAKKILGQPGRLLMGMIVIAGTAAAVNTLFSATSQLAVMVGKTAGIIFSSENKAGQARLVFILLAVAAAAMMAGGVAGSDNLDTYLRGSLILWLTNYAVIFLSLLIQASRAPDKSGSKNGFWKIIKYAVLCLLLSVTVVTLIWTDEYSTDLAGFLLITISGITLLVGSGKLLNLFQDHKRKSIAKLHRLSKGQKIWKDEF